MNIDNLIYNNEFFPILLSNNIIEHDLYQKMKQNFPNFNNYKSSNCGQLYRKNIVITKNNEEYNKLQKLNPEFVEFFKFLDSDNFKNYLINRFQNDFEKYDFIGDFNDCEIEMSICESTNNYENPWHVDTRKRIFHILIYFGKDDIQSGGEIMIGKHLFQSQYPQYPNITNLITTRKYEPNDNFGIIILSTPNSYHKGCQTLGTRRFLYIGYNNKKGSAWKHSIDWNQKKPFHIRLQEEKLN